MSIFSPQIITSQLHFPYQIYKERETFNRFFTHFSSSHLELKRFLRIQDLGVQFINSSNTIVESRTLLDNTDIDSLKYPRMVKKEQKIQSGAANEVLSSLSSLSSTSSLSSKSLYKKKYKGVRMRSWGSWVSEIRAPNQKTRIWLGSYSTPEAAARAYDAALLCLKGTSANFNFPISKSQNLHPNTIMSPKSIQMAAAAAATANGNFPPPGPPISSTSSSSRPSTPPPATPSPTISSSSPACSLIEDDAVSLAPLLISDYTVPYGYVADEPVMASWYNFDSPKYTDILLNGEFFDPLIMEDPYEDIDIPLWSFC